MAQATSSGRTRVHPVVVLFLIAVVVPVQVNLGSTLMTGLRAVLLIVIVPLTFRLLAGRYGKLLVVDIFFLIHMAWIVVALVVNNPDRALQNVGSTAVEFIGGYVVARAYIRSKADFIAMLLLLLKIILLTVPFAIYESLTSKPIILRLIDALPRIDTVAEINYEKRMGLTRAQVVFPHPILYGLFCSTGFSFAIMAIRGHVRPLRQMILMAGVALGTFLSLSSGALLSAILQLGLIVWAWIFRKVRVRWWLLLALFALVYVVIDLLSNRTPLRVMMSYATFSAHTAYYRSIIFDWGMMNVWQNPIFGLGLRDWIRPSYMINGSVDNYWLVMAMRYGIPGFLAVAIGYLAALVQVGRRDFSWDPDLTRIRLAWVLTFVGLSFTLSTVHVWTATYSFVFFLLGSGIWLVYAEPQTGGPAPVIQVADPGGRAPIRFSRQRGPGQPVLAAGAAAGAARPAVAFSRQNPASADPGEAAGRSTENRRYSRFEDKE